jgi:mono/diheme cytochrome c family protein
MKSRKVRVVAGAISIACLGGLAAVATTAQESETFDGKWRYKVSCAGCHGKDGGGIYAFGPALKGNPLVQSAPAPVLIDVIQKGRNYAERSHLAYIGMPAFPYIRGGDAKALVEFMKGEMQQ